MQSFSIGLPFKCFEWVSHCSHTKKEKYLIFTQHFLSFPRKNWKQKFEAKIGSKSLKQKFEPKVRTKNLKQKFEPKIGIQKL